MKTETQDLIQVCPYCHSTETLDLIQVCPYCHSEVSHIGPDSIDFCEDCGKVIEGEPSKFLTVIEYESL